eukprot:TRINITY_DN22277_c0_g1_i3.p1 TRINITY_DN22277_c0_g1~~TRINITY_DN22277_c0_g1_i3.p1  ORF type:complete len:369 (-),score=84.07 TRINITY_DN22277_c0_g1_i3:526-1632(-)
MVASFDAAVCSQSLNVCKDVDTDELFDACFKVADMSMASTSADFCMSSISHVSSDDEAGQPSEVASEGGLDDGAGSPAHKKARTLEPEGSDNMELEVEDMADLDLDLGLDSGDDNDLDSHRTLIMGGNPISEAGEGGMQDGSDNGSLAWEVDSAEDFDFPAMYDWPPTKSIAEDGLAMYNFASEVLTKIDDKTELVNNTDKIGDMKVGTIFSGTDLCIDTFEAVCQATKNYTSDGFYCVPTHAWFCDSDKGVQAFLLKKDEASRVALFNSVHEMPSGHCFDVRSQSAKLVADAHIVFAGWPCKDFSWQSSKRSEYRNAIQEGCTSSNSASCFRSMLSYLSTNPNLIFFIGGNVDPEEQQGRHLCATLA